MPIIDSAHIESLSRCGAFVCDLDGTLFLQNEAIPGAVKFLNHINNSDRQLYYFTNNTSLSRQTWVEKLAGFNFPVDDDQLMTSADCAAAYLKRHELFPQIYLVGNAELKMEFESRGYICLAEEKALLEEPKAVVLGFDTEISYKKIRTCYDLILRDIPYIATHPDTLCPVAPGMFKPDVGSFISMFETATGGRKPVIVGKPTREAVRFISERAGLPNDKIAFIGDRLYTDIRMAVTAGMVSVLVLSGETTEQMVSLSRDRPKIIVNSVADLVQYL